MTGGLLQLKAYGSENIYLNANPQISFFRSTYRRHTNFAMENYQLNFIGTPNLTDTSNTTFTFPIGRYADLLGPVYLVVRLPAVYSDDQLQFRWIKNIGSQIVESATLYMNGQKIQELRGSTIHMFHRMRKDYAKNLTYNQMIGHTQEFYNPKIINTDLYKASKIGQPPSIPSTELYIPLCFYFTQNTGLYLPLIALQRTQVEITITLKDITNLYTIIDIDKSSETYLRRIKPKNVNTFINFIEQTNLRTAFEIYLDSTYIFLDTDERRQFSELPHEYLIEQYQYASSINIVDKITQDMKFFHPCKEIFFYLTKNDISDINNWTNYSNIDAPGENYLIGSLDNFMYIPDLAINDIRLQAINNWVNYEQFILKTAKILFNGIDRTRELTHRYFKNVQSFQHHKGSNEYPFDENENIYVYSFSLEPDEFQPSGTCNLTNLKLFQLEVRTLLPPISRNFVIVYVKIIVPDPNYNVWYRNPDVLSPIDQDDNHTFINNIQIISLIQNTLYAKINDENIILENVYYTLEPNGTITNSMFDLTEAIMRICDSEWTIVSTYNVIEGFLYFTYEDSSTEISYKTLFLNMNTTDYGFEIYKSVITYDEYQSYTAMVTGYENSYRTIETNISSYISKLLQNKNTVNTNDFTITSVDEINKKIYAILNLNYFGVNTKFWGIIPYVNSYYAHTDGNNDVYTVPLSGLEILLYFDQLLLGDPITDVFVDGSILIYNKSVITDFNIDKKSNYRWMYNLNVEALSYNLLRVVNGEGSIVYAG